MSRLESCRKLCTELGLLVEMQGARNPGGPARYHVSREVRSAVSGSSYVRKLATLEGLSAFESWLSAYADGYAAAQPLECMIAPGVVVEVRS